MSLPSSEPPQVESTVPEAQEADCKSVWSKFFEEIRELSVYETSDCLITYQVQGENVFIYDLFVVKEKRGAFSVQLMRTFIRKFQQCGYRTISGFVDLGLKGATQRIMLWIKLGAEVIKAENNGVYLVKRIDL